MDDNDPARPRQHPVFRAQGNRGGSRTPRSSESEPAQGGQYLEEEITIPDVSGQSLEEAVKSISGTGFEVAAIETETNRRDPETVIRTNLRARTPAKPGAPVTLTRSAGATLATSSASATATN